MQASPSGRWALTFNQMVASSNLAVCTNGLMAQLGALLAGSQMVRGSNPLESTKSVGGVQIS
jgi:hypothetical protein